MPGSELNFGEPTPGLASEETTALVYAALMAGQTVTCDTPAQLLAILVTALRARAALYRNRTRTRITKREEAGLLAEASALDRAANDFARCEPTRSDGTPWDAA
jgi:hypothetical protein